MNRWIAGSSFAHLTAGWPLPVNLKDFELPASTFTKAMTCTSLQPMMSCEKDSTVKTQTCLGFNEMHILVPMDFFELQVHWAKAELGEVPAQRTSYVQAAHTLPGGDAHCIPWHWAVLGMAYEMLWLERTLVGNSATWTSSTWPWLAFWSNRWLQVWTSLSAWTFAAEAMDYCHKLQQLLPDLPQPWPRLCAGTGDQPQCLLPLEDVQVHCTTLARRTLSWKVASSTSLSTTSSPQHGWARAHLAVGLDAADAPRWTTFSTRSSHLATSTFEVSQSCWPSQQLQPGQNSER